MRLLRQLLLGMSLTTPLFAQIALSVGPEIYHLNRTREGGSRQSGRMDGFRAIASRFCPNGLYLAGDVMIANGWLSGSSSQGAPLYSEMTDRIFEARMGYTFQRDDFSSAFTPFLGGGYFCETNDFEPPSLMLFKFTDSYEYLVAGFFALRNLNRVLSIGLNFKTAFMLFGRSKISHDPLHGNIVLDMDNELQLRAELPILAAMNRCSSVEFVPFYEYRHFGGRESSPFDFIDTQFHIFGIRVALAFAF